MLILLGQLQCCVMCFVFQNHGYVQDTVVTFNRPICLAAPNIKKAMVKNQFLFYPVDQSATVSWLNIT
jgi:hypothetical protein